MEQQALLSIRAEMDSSLSLPSTLVEESTSAGNPPHDEVALFYIVALPNIVKGRWQELYDGQTIEQVRDKVYHRGHRPL